MKYLVRAVQKNVFGVNQSLMHVDDGWTVDFGKSPFVIRAYDKHKEQANN